MLAIQINIELMRPANYTINDIYSLFKTTCTPKNKGFWDSEKPLGTNTLSPKVLHENEKPLKVLSL
jgi:hypothetical protein